MQRWTALLFLGLVALAAVLVVTTRPGSMSAGAPSASGAPSAGVASSGAVVIVAPTTMTPPSFPMDFDAGALPTFTDEPGENADAGATLPDGTPVPALGSEAPKQVTFGVILVFYRGAQGAPRDARTREEALELATKLSKEAKDDFAAAVKKADVGVDNAGSMIRGVLEPGPEYTLFSLGVGDVGGPVDSPRGFYVFKRIE
jgi:hypothetical protein